MVFLISSTFARTQRESKSRQLTLLRTMDRQVTRSFKWNEGRLRGTYLRILVLEGFDGAFRARCGQRTRPEILMGLFLLSWW
jgi:hypothetical protein